MLILWVFYWRFTIIKNHLVAHSHFLVNHLQSRGLLKIVEVLLILGLDLGSENEWRLSKECLFPVVLIH